jgi:hypothetical protein
MNELAAEVEIAKQAIERVREVVGDDDADFLTLVESETDALEILRRLLRRARRAEAEAAAVKAMRHELVEELAAREERHAQRSEALRRAVIWAMGELGLPKIMAPDFTASLSTPAHGPVEVPDADAVPTEFCRVVKSPDKVKIKELLEGGLIPNWASFAPAKPKLQIRTR